MPVLVALGWGLAVGLACGGSIRALGTLRLRGDVLILPCFVVQALLRGRGLGFSGVASLALLAWASASLVLAACLIANRRTPGCFLGALGLLLNVAVVLANGGMPVSARPGSEWTTVLVEGAQRSFYVAAHPSTLLPFVGDVVPFGAGGAWLMLSVGDILLLIGVCTVAICAMQSSHETGRPGWQ